MKIALEILDSLYKGTKATPVLYNEAQKTSEQNMVLTISYTLFSVPGSEKGKIDKNPVFLTMLQQLLPEMQKKHFGFVGSDSSLDFKEAYIGVMGLMLDKKLYTDFAILHRMRLTSVYSLWEAAGDFLQERGYPIHAFTMYVGVALMRMETRPKDRNNAITLRKAVEMALKINTNGVKPLFAYGFKDVWKKWPLENPTNISAFLQAHLNKAIGMYFIQHGLCFHTAIDCEVMYLETLANLGFFNDNYEWLVCNLLSLVLATLDVTHGGRRLKQARNLILAARTVMARCDVTHEKYNTLYELYQLCKSSYWALKLETDVGDISNRYVPCDMTTFGTNTSHTMSNDTTYQEIWMKLRGISDILQYATNKDIAKVFSEIMLNCRKQIKSRLECS